MRAAVFNEHGGIDKLQVQDVPVPQIGPNDVLIKVKACGVNHLDLLVRSARVPVKVAFPHISGSEVAGDIEAVGDQVTGLTRGQAVVVAPYLFDGTCEFCLAGEEPLCLRGDILGLMSNGGYAEYVKVPAISVLPIPAGVSYEEAAAVALSAITAWHMLVARAQVKPGEDVLVLAAGSGVGSYAVQIAKLCGARVITTAGTEDKLAKAKELGADEIINHREQDFQQEVRRITNKRGVDIVVEHVGAATWDKSVGSLARNGRVVTCGATTGGKADLDIWRLFATETRVIGSYGGTRAELKQVLKLVSQGKLRAVIDRTFPLEAAAEAQQRMEASQQFGKMLLIP